MENRWNNAVLNADAENYNSTVFKENLIKYALENTAKLDVYIRQPFAESIVVDEAQSTISFISNLGGIMGVCMGFSLVSVCDAADSRRPVSRLQFSSSKMGPPINTRDLLLGDNR